MLLFRWSTPSTPHCMGSMFGCSGSLRVPACVVAPRALAAALLFGAHPVNTEAVIWRRPRRARGGARARGAAVARVEAIPHNLSLPLARARGQGDGNCPAASMRRVRLFAGTKPPERPITAGVVAVACASARLRVAARGLCRLCRPQLSSARQSNRIHQHDTLALPLMREGSLSKLPPPRVAGDPLCGLFVRRGPNRHLSI